MIDQVTEPKPPLHLSNPPPYSTYFFVNTTARDGKTSTAVVSPGAHTQDFSLKSLDFELIHDHEFDRCRSASMKRHYDRITQGILPTYWSTIGLAWLELNSWSSVGGPAKWCPVPIGRRERGASRRPASSRQPAGSCRRSATAWATPAILQSIWIVACLEPLDTMARYACVNNVDH